MKLIVLLPIFFCLAGVSEAIAQHAPSILVFSKTAGFRHDSIETGAEAIQALGKAHGFQVDHSEDATLFNDEQLGKYQAILFLSTTGEILNADQKAAFQRFIQAGKGFVGIHAASDTEYNWPWYGGLVGGYFANHPEVQMADILVQDHQHPATQHLPIIWQREDEWYDFQNMNPKVHVLMTLDENSYSGGGMGDYHPLCWYHAYDGGRAFYTALGHTKEAYQEADFLTHILGGIQYAIGDQQNGLIPDQGLTSVK